MSDTIDSSLLFVTTIHIINYHFIIIYLYISINKYTYLFIFNIDDILSILFRMNTSYMYLITSREFMTIVIYIYLYSYQSFVSIIYIHCHFLFTSLFLSHSYIMFMYISLYLSTISCIDTSYHFIYNNI